MKSSKLHKYFSGLTRNSFLLAFASLFSDISTEMLYPVLPIYLTQTLKAGGSVVGIVEGVAQATQNIVQGFSGWYSDKLKKRKPIALFGYTLSALAKPLIGLTNTWQGVLGARFLDRFGTGTRSAPRDALIAESADEKNRGKAFGLEGVGDNLGAFLGPLITIFLLFALVKSLHQIFILAIIPGLLAAFMILLVKEDKAKVDTAKKIKVDIRQFPKTYWKYLLATAVFGLGNSSNSFLILQTKDVGVTLEFTILIYAFFNIVAALVSYPAGSLSDKLGRKNVLLLSYLVFIFTYLGFALSTNLYLIGVLFITYGIYQGIFRAVGKAFASDFVNKDLRASAIGWYSTTIGLTGLTSSIIAGQLWDKVGHSAVFVYGSIFAFLGGVLLFFLMPKDKNPINR